MNKHIIFLCILIVLFTSCGKRKKGYAIPGLKHGLLQSPINIISKEAHDGEHHITLHYQDEVNNIEHRGRTVRLEMEKGNTVSSNGVEYTFAQIHFHTPAEHLIDGITYPLEMHLVNTAEKEDGSVEYLIIALHFKMGEDNKFIEQVLGLIPTRGEKPITPDSSQISLRMIDKKMDGRYIDDTFFYKGSLTTKPYTESANWYIVKHIFEASPQQIKALNTIEGNNARHIQALYGREIE